MTDEHEDAQEEEAAARQRLGEAQVDAQETLEQAEQLSDDAPRRA